MQTVHRDILYKLEDQENQNRRQNLRIRALPQQNREDLDKKIKKKKFNLVLGRGEGDDLKIDRVHRVRKPPGLNEDVPRDVIVKFHLYEDKAKIWSKLSGLPHCNMREWICRCLQTYQQEPWHEDDN